MITSDIFEGFGPSYLTSHHNFHMCPSKPAEDQDEGSWQTCFLHSNDSQFKWMLVLLVACVRKTTFTNKKTPNIRLLLFNNKEFFVLGSLVIPLQTCSFPCSLWTRYFLTRVLGAF